jgi:hypothetical protein
MNTPSTDEQLILVERQKNVAMFEALDRLKQNPDFQKVILEEYFKNKAVDGVSLLATEYVIQNNLRSQVMESLIAISHLEDYFNVIDSLGRVPDEDDEDE